MVTIKQRADNALVAATLETARKVILDLAGFTCIHDRPPGSYFGYCSGCPLNHIGEDKGAFDSDQSRIICTERRAYGK